MQLPPEISTPATNNQYSAHTQDQDGNPVAAYDQFLFTIDSPIFHPGNDYYPETKLEYTITEIKFIPKGADPEQVKKLKDNQTRDFPNRIRTNGPYALCCCSTKFGQRQYMLSHPSSVIEIVRSAALIMSNVFSTAGTRESEVQG